MGWYFLPTISVQKSPTIQWGARSASAYGNRYAYDNAGYTKTGSFEAEFLTQAEVDTVVAAAILPWSEAGSTVTLNVNDVDWAGKVVSCNFQRIGGTIYYSGSVTLDSPAIV